MSSSGDTEGELQQLKNITKKSTSKGKKASNKSEDKVTSAKEPKSTAVKTKKEVKEPKGTATKTKKEAKEPKNTAAKSKSKDESSPTSLNSMDTWSTESSWNTSDEEFLASDDEDADAREQLDEICNMLRKGRCNAN